MVPDVSCRPPVQITYLVTRWCEERYSVLILQVIVLKDQGERHPSMHAMLNYVLS